MRPCMIRKCGLLTFSCTEWNRFCTRLRCYHTMRQRIKSEVRLISSSVALHKRAARTPGLRHVSIDQVLVAAADNKLRRATPQSGGQRSCDATAVTLVLRGRTCRVTVI